MYDLGDWTRYDLNPGLHEKSFCIAPLGIRNYIQHNYTFYI